MVLKFCIVVVISHILITAPHFWHLKWILSCSFLIISYHFSNPLRLKFNVICLTAILKQLVINTLYHYVIHAAGLSKSFWPDLLQIWLFNEETVMSSKTDTKRHASLEFYYTVWHCKNRSAMHAHLWKSVISSTSFIIPRWIVANERQ